MKNMQLISTILLIALYTRSVESKDCMLHALICESIGTEESYIEHNVICNATSSTYLPLGSSVSSVVLNNGSEVANLAKIEGLRIKYAKVNFIPTNLGTKFPNLKVLIITSSGLFSVNKESLKESGDSLQFLYLAKNNITSIESDLLEYNSNIKSFDLSLNPIQHIDPMFFTNLMNLRSITRLYLKKTECMDILFKTSESDIAKFKWKNEKCTNEKARSDTRKLIEEATCGEIRKDSACEFKFKIIHLIAALLLIILIIIIIYIKVLISRMMSV